MQRFVMIVLVVRAVIAMLFWSEVLGQGLFFREMLDRFCGLDRGVSPEISTLIF